MCVATSCVCSDEVNLLIQHYLQELGYEHAAFAFGCESRLPFQPIARRRVPSGSLVYLVQKGVILSQIEAAASRAADVPNSVQTQLGQLHQELRQQLDTLQENAEASSKLRPLDRFPCFLDDRAALFLVAHSRGLTSVSFSPDGARLATASMDGSAVIWRIDPAAHAIFDRPVLTEFDSDATCLAWSRDSALLAVGTFDGVVVVIAGRSELARLSRGKSPIVAIDFHSNPDVIVFADARGLVCIARRGAVVAHVALDGALCDVFWASDDTALAACEQRLHSVTMKGGHHVVATAKSAIVQAVPDRARQCVAIGDDAGFVSVVDIAQRSTASVHMLHRGGVRGVASAADPGTFASVGADAGVKMFTAGRGEAREFVGHAAATYLVACDPKGRWLASVGAEGVVAVWGIEAHKVLISYNVEQRPVNCIAWEPEGRFLAVGMDSGAVAIIDFQQLPFH